MNFSKGLIRSQHPDLIEVLKSVKLLAHCRVRRELGLPLFGENGTRDEEAEKAINNFFELGGKEETYKGWCARISSWLENDLDSINDRKTYLRISYRVARETGDKDKAGKITSAYEDITESISEVKKQIEESKKKSSEIKEQIRSLEEKRSEIKEQIRSLEEKRSGIGEQIKNLEKLKTVPGINERIKDCKKKRSEVGKQIRSLEKKRFKVEKQIRSLEKKRSEVEEQIRSLEEKESEVKEQIRSLEEKRSKIGKQIKNLDENSSEIKNLNKKKSEIGKQIKNLAEPMKIYEIWEEYSDFQEQFGKELEKLQVLYDSEAEFFSFSLKELVQYLPFISALIIVGGYFYVFTVYSHFNIETSQFFSFDDYLDASVEKIASALYLVGIYLVYFFAILWGYRNLTASQLQKLLKFAKSFEYKDLAEKVQSKYRRLQRRLNSRAVNFYFGVFLFMLVVKLGKSELLLSVRFFLDAVLPCMIILFLAWCFGRVLNSWRIKKPEYFKNDFTNILLLSIFMFFSSIYIDAQIQIAKVECKPAKVSEKSVDGPYRGSLIGLSNRYIFLRSDKSDNNIIIPRSEYEEIVISTAEDECEGKYALMRMYCSLSNYVKSLSGLTVQKKSTGTCSEKPAETSSTNLIKCIESSFKRCEQSERSKDTPLELRSAPLIRIISFQESLA